MSWITMCSKDVLEYENKGKKLDKNKILKFEHP